MLIEMNRVYGICDVCGSAVRDDNLAGYDEDGHVYCTDPHRPVKWVRANKEWTLQREG